MSFSTCYALLEHNGGPLARCLFGGKEPAIQETSYPSARCAWAKKNGLSQAIVPKVELPISAMSCGPRAGPTPNIPITTGYSGSDAARDCISFLRAAKSAEAARSWDTA